MRLISCHINNFGNLKNVDIDFTANLNTYYLPNGKGKSTLAYFIMAMFYGLDKISRTKFTDRLRYFPFDGQGCGGRLTFFYQDKEYRIERSFSPKSETQDEIKIFINNKEVNLGDKNVGYFCFGIDKEAFERTIFVTSKDIELKSNDTINTKLNNLAIGLNDDANLANALKILDNETKKYQKQISVNALIPMIKIKIEELTQKKTNLEQIAATLASKSEELTSLKSKQQELDKTINEAEEINRTLDKWQVLENYHQEVYDIKTNIKSLKMKYGPNLPTLKACDEIANLIRENDKIDIQLKENKLNELEQEEYHKLLNKYKNKDLTSEISNVEAKLNNYEELETKRKVLQQAMQNDDNKMHLQFKDKLVSQEDLTALDNLVTEYNKLQKQIVNEADFKEVRTKASKLPSLIVSLLGFIIVIVGIILVSKYLTIGISLLALGFCLVLGAIFIFTSGTKVKPVRNEHKLNLESITKEKETSINQLFLSYGYDIKEDLNHNLAQIKIDYKNYLELQKAINNNALEFKNVQIAIKNLADELDSYFLNYRIFADTYSNKMVKLKTEYNNFLLFNNKFANCQKLLMEGEKNKAVNSQKIASFKEKYQINNLDIDEVKKDILRYNQEEELLKNKESNIKKYQEDNALTTKPKLDFNLEELRNERNKILDDINRKKEEVTNAQDASESLTDILAELEEQNTKLLEAKETYKLLYLARKYLVLADENLRNKYISPIKNEFVKYANLLEATLGEKLSMTSNYEITFEREGKIRQVKHLSDGELAICTFCFRLALINKMYDNDKPFIILDDPFVALDEAHLAKMQTIIKELAKEQQLLYFTCHKSRNIEA